MRWRGKIAVSTALALAIGGTAAAVAGSDGAGIQAERSRRASRALRVEVFYRAPVLVRAGESVRMPVDVVCATPSGRACPATITVGAAAGSAAPAVWATASAPGNPRLLVDLTAAARASRAAGGGTDVVRFFIRASAAGRVMALGSQSDTGALRFYVAGRIRRLDVPAIPFGRVRPGKTVLALPWGTGPMRAGIAIGNQSATVGPSAFDVGTRRRVYLLDELQGRLVVFRHRAIVRETRVRAVPPADLAVGADDTAWVLSQPTRGDGVVVRSVGRDGAHGPVAKFGGIPGRIRTVGRQAFIHLLPLDAWARVPAPGDTPSAGVEATMTGEPSGGRTQILSVVNGGAVRLGTVQAGRVRNCVQLRFKEQLGELAFARADGRGGYWVVQHVWRDGARSADQYQVVHVAGGRVLSTFGVANRTFAQGAILSRFRMGPDGALYQLQSSPAGMRIVRYELGGGS